MTFNAMLHEHNLPKADKPDKCAVLQETTYTFGAAATNVKLRETFS